ncbi:ABC1 kinase family protein [Paenibacillus macquariensis]|uniref:Ubiquinone biosynthesis protein n=1 Tax=Paenibacillus macquariensis TaxID=948756 RepID=A0ABY1K9Q4_9BACL|nr:AarF/ABC1/UbiB kinase family protein [Paenibacillus macquariensis]MEC0092440.1 AarF/ABC1/UbiB kinase family protein [Paenibacillus macquariensis]OAB35403.1 ABC transporter [Paenibacillus macquariensis subsp. macquariensis]SIR47368.1 ubiquinone biosynthesis protein [Paenibacillus macquariensis]
MAVRIRHTGRYREIAMALMRHGFGYMVEELELFQVLTLPRRWITHESIETKTIGERIRHVLEDLGPTFIKLGQLASTRSDLLPDDIISELVKLQDQVPAFSSETARGILEQELDITIEDGFSWFEDTPIAAASIGQVHIGKLRTGETVAVKIQRPGVMKMVSRDLDIISGLAEMIEKRWEWARQYQLTRIVAELTKSILAELDYSQEARNTEKISLQFQNDRHIYIPHIYWEFTSSRVLTMEYIEGIMLSRRDQLLDKGYDLKEIAGRVTNGMLHQIFIEGFFHGDPHPGNLLARKDGSIAFIDFGMVGRISEDMKDQLSALIIALMRKNTDGMVRAILKLGLFPEEGDISSLRADLDRMRDEYYDIPFTEISMGKALNDLFGVARQHQIIIPPDLTLLGKALLTLEGVMEKLDPSLSIIDMAEPFGKKLLKEKYSAGRLQKKFIGGVAELLEGMLELPGQARQLSSLISKGKVKVEINVPELQSLMRKMDQISNRLSMSIVLLSFSIIMVGLIIGSALNNPSSVLWHLPVIGLGFIVALFMVIWLLYGIFKSGRF